MADSVMLATARGPARPPLARRTEPFIESVIREMTRLGDEAGATNLSQGLPDFDPPEEVLEAALSSLREGHNQYTPRAVQLRQAPRDAAGGSPPPGPAAGSVRPVTVQLIARSVSRPVWERLQEEPFTAHVMAVFERACDLVTTDGKVVALVTPQVGDGPLNVVVDGRPGCFAGLSPGTRAMLEGKWLRLGGLTVSLEKAAVWEPRPDWDTLQTRQAVVADRLPLLHNLALRHAPAGSLLALLEGRGNRDDPAAAGPPSAIILAVAQEAATTLRQGWPRDRERMREGAAGLAGLGSGLTPAGDDFLAGVMLWAWLAHPTPGPLCATLVDAAAPRTTTISAAILRAAARGECSAPWQRLLKALSGEVKGKIEPATREVLAHGATSGADALAGFLYVGLETTGEYASVRSTPVCAPPSPE